jgi:hypothetical protein
MVKLPVAMLRTVASIIAAATVTTAALDSIQARILRPEVKNESVGMAGFEQIGQVVAVATVARDHLAHGERVLPLTEPENAEHSEISSERVWVFGHPTTSSAVDEASPTDYRLTHGYLNRETKR